MQNYHFQKSEFCILQKYWHVDIFTLCFFSSLLVANSLLHCNSDINVSPLHNFRTVQKRNIFVQRQFFIPEKLYYRYCCSRVPNRGFLGTPGLTISMLIQLKWMKSTISIVLKELLKKKEKNIFFLTAIRVQEGLRGNDATKENFFRSKLLLNRICFMWML